MNGSRRGGPDWGLGRVGSCARTLERGGVLGEAGGVGDPGSAGVRWLRRRRPRGRAVVGWGRRRCLCRRHGAASSSSSSPLPFFGLSISRRLSGWDGQGFSNGLFVFPFLELGRLDNPVIHTVLWDNSAISEYCNKKE